MDNNALNARLQRDIDTAAGLLTDKSNYAPLEDDMGPLRTQHATNLDAARLLAAEVLTDGQEAGDSTDQKKTARQQLKPLAGRLAAALQAFAASAANTDDTLAGRVSASLTQLSNADGTTFGDLVGNLLTEAQPLGPQLEKREFTPADLALTTQLLARFTKKKSSQRLSVVDGSTARKTFIGLLKQNADLIRKMRVQLKPYQNSPTKHAVWERFQGYTKVIERKGGGGAAEEATPKA